MLRPRVRLVVAAMLFTASTVLGASCSFPGLTFDNGSSGSGGSTGALMSTSSTSSTTATSTGSVGGAGNSSSSTSSESASTSGSSSSGEQCMTPCDCDGDGYKAMLGGCGGKDCADYDPRAHPDAAFLRDPQKIQGPRTTGLQDYDFDCDGSVFPEAKTIMCGLLASGVCGGEGFAADTACGVPGAYIHCGLNGLNCVAVKTEMRVQGCH